MKREGINRLGVFGPGGIKCHCCAPGKKLDRRKFVRAARRKMKRRSITEGKREVFEDKQEEH